MTSAVSRRGVVAETSEMVVNKMKNRELSTSSFNRTSLFYLFG